jgi:OOP family OmpA-OmpF porin
VTRLAPLLVLVLQSLVWAAQDDVDARLALTVTESAVRIEGDVNDDEHAAALMRLAALHFPDRTLEVNLAPRAGEDSDWQALTIAVIPMLEDALGGRLVLEPRALELISILSGPTEPLQAHLDRLDSLAGDGFSIHWETHAPASPAASARSCARMFRELGHSGIRFRFGTADLTPASHAHLDRYVEFAEDCPRTRLRIAGHTDSWGDETLNQALSERRAQAVRDYLVAAGIDQARVEAEGKGSAEPIADNNTTWGRSRNRRIELTLAP